MSTDKEFYELLSSIAEEQVFSLELPTSDKEKPLTLKFRQLTTSQLKDLVKSAVDSPLTQAAFNSTVTKIFKESLVTPSPVAFDVIDRLFFILETRIQSFSAEKEVEHEGKKITVNFETIKSKLKKQLESNKNAVTTCTATEGKVKITFGVPFVHTELQLNEELYKDTNLDVQNTEELRKMIGEAFVNEIAKSIYSISIEDKELDLNQKTFKQRLKVVESLPASLIQKVINYIEKYKKVIETSLTVDGYLVPIDSTLFSLR